MRRQTIVLFILGCLLVLAGSSYVYLTVDLPSPDAVVTRASPDATKILDRNGRLLYEVLDPRAGRRTRVPLAQLPLSLRHAIIAVEDADFYQNPGWDPVGIVRAAWLNLSSGEIVAGGSTITQQLARALLMSREEQDSRTITRKLREAILAARLTRTFSKDAILEMYLNEVYFGQLAYGVEAAAQAYFDKPARDLDLAEAALLAGLVQSPATYDPLVNLDAARARQRVVLGLMVKKGYLSEAQAQLAEKEPLHFATSDSGATLRAPHFVAYVRSLLESRYGVEAVNRGGLKVVTTLDLDLQEHAQATINRQLADLARRAAQGESPDPNVHDAALVALDPTNGQILAMVGSADYFNKEIAGAVNVALAKRQPGSAIKPITYAAAFSRGLTPATVFSDVPTTFLTKEETPYQPQNYDRIWYGPISLRQALATSSNMVAVQVLDRIGLQPMIETARALGISTFDETDRFGLALTLGGGEVTLVELTAAYAALANAGRRVEPVAILSVNGVPWSTPNPPVQALSPQVAYLITDILSDNAARAPAFGEDNALQLTRPAAAKTGTTTDFHDNWTVGYTPDLAVGVWVGNADNSPMIGISGITGAGPIWHDFMEAALKGRPVRSFIRPDGLVKTQVCATSGLLPTKDCPRRRTEIFIAGTQPTAYDDTFRTLPIDGATGLLWADGCRGPQMERVFRILPPEAAEWGRRQGIPEPPQVDCRGEPIPWSAAKEQGAIGTATQGDSGAIEHSKAISSSPALTITSPPLHSNFQLSVQLPLQMQQIEVTARPSATAALSAATLLIDGRPVATFSRPPYRALWEPTPGEHTAKAVGVDRTGKRVESEPILFWVGEEN